MSEISESIMRGLEEALDHSEGKLELRTRTVSNGEAVEDRKKSIYDIAVPLIDTKNFKFDREEANGTYERNKTLMNKFLEAPPVSEDFVQTVTRGHMNIVEISDLHKELLKKIIKFEKGQRSAFRYDDDLYIEPSAETEVIERFISDYVYWKVHHKEWPYDEDYEAFEDLESDER